MGESKHLITNTKVDHSFADLLDDASKVTALAGRESGWPTLGQGALADHRLTWIDARCFDANNDLTGPRFGAVDFYHFQNFKPTIGIKFHSTRHDFSPFLIYAYEIRFDRPSIRATTGKISATVGKCF